MASALFGILGLLLVSCVLLWQFRKLRLPAILAYLVAGVLIGPDVLGWLTYTENIHLAAEIGIVFLLFTLGLEFSLVKLVAMKTMVFGLGAGQVILTMAVFACIAVFIGQDISSSIIIGGIIALSSTAVVIKLLSDSGQIQTPRGQAAISILLFQDLAVVPLLIVIPLLADADGASMVMGIVWSLIKGAFVVAILLSAGKWVLPSVYNDVANTRNDELFVLTTIFVALLAAGITYAFGLSMALGAFLAGMMLSESQYRHQIEADIRPFRDILMGLFFITVGMQLSISLTIQYLHWIIVGTLAVLTIKILVVRLIAQFMSLDKTDAWVTAIRVSQLGEFGFVLAALGFENGLFTQLQHSLFISVGLLSMAVTPWLFTQADKFASNQKSNMPPTELTGEGGLKDAEVLVLGYGRVGQTIARMLKLEGISFNVIDNDPKRVQESRAAGVNIIYGDSTSRDILNEAISPRFKLAVITFDDTHQASVITAEVKELSTDATVIVRTRKDVELDALYEAGATQVVPEKQEAGLMLVSQVLHYAGIPMSRILKRIRNERQKGYVHMHGFFPGDTTEINLETRDSLEFLHAVTLTADAFACGKEISELDFNRSRVKISALRRASQEVEFPASETILQAQDVLILSGKPRRVERVERYILTGN